MKKLIVSLFLSVLVACGGVQRDSGYHLQTYEILELNRGVVALVVPDEDELTVLGVEDPHVLDNVDTQGKKHTPFCSGFFINSTTIMTAAHCVSRREVVETLFGPVRLPTADSPVGDLKKIVSYAQAIATSQRMDTYRVYVVIKWDPAQDLAILRLQEGQMPHNHISILPISTSSQNFGDRVYAIGHPAGQSWTVTEGIVSNPQRLSRSRIPGGRTVYHKVIQASAQVFYGNSGGPLVNNRNEVVGVCSKMIETHLAFFTHTEAMWHFLRGVSL